MRALLVVCALAACAKKHEPQPPKPASYLLVGVADAWTSTRATLRLFRATTGGWEQVGAAWPAVLGASGLAWGKGLHGDGAPPGHAGPVKHEGDGRSPAGKFALRGAYGYAAAAPPGARLPYTHTDRSWLCIDDPASPHYAQIVDRRAIAQPDWASAEQLARNDELYTWVVDVAHNAARIPGDGSCIFLHVWQGPDSTTVGCTAMAEPELAHLVATLDPDTTYVLLPRDEYRALAAPWHLPSL